MDFKAQIASDMKVFHNCGEFGTMTDLWYQGKQYTVPMIIDHTAAGERQKQKTSRDNSEGIYRVDCLAYVSQYDLGFIPKKNRQIEIDIAGAVELFQIEKVEYEDGEIILELVVLDE